MYGRVVIQFLYQSYDFGFRSSGWQTVPNIVDIYPFANPFFRLGIINGSDGNLNPKALMTRGEMAVMIYNCLKTGVASQYR